MQNSQNKTVHEVKNGRNVRSGAHVFDHFCSSFPSSFLQGAIFFVSSQICHTSSDIGTDWIAFCRSRFYLTVAKVPLFHCYDILKLAQLVLLLGHCLGRFMTHDMLWSSCDDPTCQASILQEACTTSSGAKTARGLECLECLWSTVDIQAMRADADSSAQMRLSGADFRLYCSI